MVIKLFLTAGLLASLLVAVSERASTRLLRVLMAAVTLPGIYFIWFPDSTSSIAELVGVGRGADLVIYCWIVVSLLFILILHLRLARLDAALTDLARHIATSEARTQPAERPDSRE